MAAVAVQAGNGRQIYPQGGGGKRQASGGRGLPLTPVWFAIFVGRVDKRAGVCYTPHAMSVSTKNKAEQACRARLYRAEQAKAHLSIRIDRDVFEILTKTAEELRLSRGAIVERALDFYFKVARLAPEKLPPAWLS
jgi:hypothetical protein